MIKVESFKVTFYRIEGSFVVLLVRDEETIKINIPILVPLQKILSNDTIE